MTAYKTVVRTACFLAAALVFTLAAHAAEPTGSTLSNADIVSMTQANVAPTLIINRIYSSSNAFDLSDQAFMELKASGVADEVLNAMLAAVTGNAANTAATAANNAANNILSQIPALPPIGGGSQPPALSLPPLGGGSDWSDFGEDLASLPPPPALPAFSAPPVSTQAISMPPVQTQAQAFSVPPAQTLPQMPSFSAPPTAAPVMPAAPVAAAPVMPVMPVTPVAQAPAFSAPPPATMSVQSAFAAQQPAAAVPASTAYDARRFDSELAAISGGSSEAARAALAWMFANRQQTLPGLRQALTAARPEMQAGALQVLGDMNDQQSLPMIRDLLGNPSPLVRKEAAKALARMNDTAAIGAAEQNLGNPVEPLDGLIHLVGYARLVRASEQLGTILSTNASALNRAAAASALAEIGPEASAAWPAVQNALANDADAPVRREAARAVARFHDAASAGLLMNACRSDPEVRRVTLESMAEYPETVEFLVGVLGLGPDQIAPDESEAARAGLAKLTGQNFGLDGAQWSAWFAANRSRFAPGAPAAAPAVESVLAGLPGISASPVPLPPPSADMAAVAGQPGQVDITALGMIVDPSQIPMAPEVAEGRGSLGGGLPGSMLAVPAGLGLGEGDSASAGGGMIVPDREPAVGAGRLPTPAGFEEYADDQMWSGSMPSAGAGGMGGGGAGMPTPASSMSALPPTPSVVGPAAPSSVDAGGPGDSGLQLALPPMGGMSDSGMYGDASAAVPADAFGGYDAGSYDDGTGAAAADPFADPYAEQYTDGGMAEITPLDGGGEYDSFDDALSAPPGGATDTLAFPGDTDSFGIGEPMFADDGSGDFAESDFGDGSGGFALPPPPGGGADGESFAESPDGDFADFGDFGELDSGDFADTETYTDASGAATEAPAAPAQSFENYDYGEFDDGMHDGDADFASDDFAAFLQGTDLGASETDADAPAGSVAAAEEDSPETAPAGASFEGTADWAPTVGEVYTPDSPEDGRSGGATTMEWVRGVGLVEREAPVPAPAAPASSASSSAETLPEPVPVETIVPSGPPPTESAGVEQEGGWFYVDSSEGAAAAPEASAASAAETPLPVIDTEVYELPEPVEAIPADPSGRPSRRLRMQR